MKARLHADYRFHTGTFFGGYHFSKTSWTDLPDSFAEEVEEAGIFELAPKEVVLKNDDLDSVLDEVESTSKPVAARGGRRKSA